MTPPEKPVPPAGDPYARLQYGRLFDWDARLGREGEFLEAVAAAGPDRSVLDLGCGTGDHARYFAARGYRTLGLDASPHQIAAAAAGPALPGLEFRTGDLTDLATTVDERFGTVLCIGNTLVHLQDDAALDTACRGVFGRLFPGGAWLVQILNFARLRARGERALPVHVRPGDDGEFVFLRLLRPLDADRLEFLPTTLRWQPASVPPLELVAAHPTVWRGWLRADLEGALHRAGFVSVEWFGGMRREPFSPDTSTDLVCVARRS